MIDHACVPCPGDSINPLGVKCYTHRMCLRAPSWRTLARWVVILGVNIMFFIYRYKNINWEICAWWNADKISDHSSGDVALDQYHRYKVINHDKR
jgi:hypothetical protein